MSTENVAADSWDDVNADPVGNLVEKMEKVKLLQRKEQKKEEYFEKVKSEDNGSVVPKLQSQDGSEAAIEEPKRVFLRRPKDGFASETVADSSPESAQSTESRSDTRSRQPAKTEIKKPTKTLEQRQADYQAARDRIMGSEYKPDNQEIKEIKMVDRSKSPETLRMTEQNMLAHYGEELSRELMQQPVEPVVTPERQFIPDFTKPPPNMMMGQQMFQPPNMDNHFYQQPNQIPMHFMNQQHFAPPDASTISSSSQQNHQKNEQNMFYFQQSQAQHNQQPQQMNYMHYNLPNTSYPPPNMFPNPPGQQLNQAHMNPMQQVPPQFYKNTQDHSPNGRTPNANGAVGGRVQNRRGPNMVMFPIGQPVPLMQNEFRGGAQVKQNGQFQNNQSNKKNNVRANFSVPPPNQQGTNIIPFGCPPRHVNAIREQYGMVSNSGNGLLGAHPSTQPWAGPQQ